MLSDKAEVNDAACSPSKSLSRIFSKNVVEQDVSSVCEAL